MTPTLKEQSETLIHSGLPNEAMSPQILMFGRILAETRSPDTGAMVFSDEASGTQNGWAISPMRAQACLADAQRTLAFMRGVYKAVSDVRKTVTERPIRLLYAGCGPLAPLVMPSLALFGAEALQVTLLDMHEESLASVKMIVEAQGLSECIAAYELGDAGAFQIDQDAPPDIILMEILESCLDQEPQVGVSRHLMAQCPDAILIPEDITVSMALVNPEKEFSIDGSAANFDRIEVGDVFTLNKGTIESWASIDGEILPAAEVTVPEYSSRVYAPVLRTVIHTYSGHVLRDYATGLTVPRAHDSLAAAAPGAVLKFQYRTGAQPTLFVS